MRIVSQDGTVDLPYELTSVFMDNTMMQISAMFSGQEQTLAMYPNEEKCRKVLKMLRDTYTGVFFAQNIEFDPECNRDLADMIKKKGFGIITVSRDSRDVEFKPGNIVFRFPKYDEV